MSDRLCGLLRYLLIALILIGIAHGQVPTTADCTATAPCVPLTFTNPSVPVTAVILSCVGSATTCSQSSLNSYIAQQTPANFCPSVNKSPWKCTTFQQTQTPLVYNDPEPPNAFVNYAFEWFTPSGKIQQFQVSTQ